jgi:plastocyanin
VRKLIALLVVAALAALGVAGATVAIPAFAATKAVRVDDNFFSPKTIRVKRGDRIRFRWTGSAPHNVKGAGINIGTRRSGSRTVRVRRSGTIVCTIHPGMTARIRVSR